MSLQDVTTQVKSARKSFCNKWRPLRGHQGRKKESAVSANSQTRYEDHESVSVHLSGKQEVNLSIASARKLSDESFSGSEQFSHALGPESVNYEPVQTADIQRIR